MGKSQAKRARGKVLTVNLDDFYQPSAKQKKAHADPHRYVLFGGSMGGGKTVGEDTPVYTPHGPVPIQDISPGDEVWSLDSDYKLQRAKVVGVDCVGLEPAFLIKTTTGNELTCSHTHPLLTAEGWKRIEQLEPGEHIALARKQEVDTNHPEIEDWYVKVMGYLLGDGTIGESPPHWTCVNPVQVAEMKELLPEYLQLHLIKSDTGCDYSINRTDKTIGRRNPLVTMLKEDGVFGHRSYTKFIPERFKRLPLHQTAMLLNRLYATDGWIWGSGVVGFASVSKRLAYDVKELLLRFGIVASIYVRKTPSPFGLCYEVCVSRATDIKIFCTEIGAKGKEKAVAIALERSRKMDKSQSHGIDIVPKKLFRDDPGLAASSFPHHSKGGDYRMHLRDRKRLNVCRGYLQTVVESDPAFESLGKHAYSDVFWDKIVSITDLKEEVEMWDLQIDPNSNFVANGIIVHNSYWLCAEAIQLSIDFPGNVGLICRLENSSFKKTTLRTLLKILPPPLVLNHHRTEQYIDFVNGSRLYYGGLRSSGQGKNEGSTAFDRIKSMDLGHWEIDELTEVPKEFFLLLCSRLRLPGVYYRGAAATNPEPGWVRDTFIDNPGKNHKFIPALPKDNPFLPDGYVEDLREQFDDEWVQKYLEGSWDAATDQSYVFPYKHLRGAIERESSPEEHDGVHFGVDIARGGNKAVIAVRHGPRITIPWQRVVRDTTKILKAVRDYNDLLNPIAIRIDTTGVGGPIYDVLKKEKLPVVEFIAGAKADKPAKFLNVRSESYWKVRQLLLKGALDLPDNRQMLVEMSSIKYEIVRSKKVKIQSKEEMDGGGRKSPDITDAIVMAAGTNKMPGVNVYFFGD